jgi:mono/diheme cytochrome c family protein
MKTKNFIPIAVITLSLVFMSMTNLSINYQDSEPWEVPAKYEKMENPYAGATDSENIGRALYSKHCKSCHGSKGLGDGPKADSVDTPIGDFTVASFQDQSDGSLYYKTFIGRDDMPSFQKKVKEEEDQWMIVNYLRTLSK